MIEYRIFQNEIFIVNVFVNEIATYTKINMTDNYGMRTKNAIL